MPASVLMPSDSAPLLRVTISPNKTVSTAHQASFPVTVINGGSSAITVRSSVMVQGAGGCQAARVPSWLTVSPASAVVQPGHLEHATVTVDAPPGTTGSYDTLAVFTAHPAATPHGATGVTVGGAVGTRVDLVYGGKQVHTPCVAVTSPHHPVAARPSGTTGVSIALAGALVLACLLVLATVLVTRHRRQVRGNIK